MIGNFPTTKALVIIASLRKTPTDLHIKEYSGEYNVSTGNKASGLSGKQYLGTSVSVMWSRRSCVSIKYDTIIQNL